MNFSHPDYDFDVNQNKTECNKCGGRGVSYIPNSSPPVSVRCECAIKRDKITNIERGWFGLSRVEPIKSQLIKFINKNLWITSTLPKFMGHMKYVAETMDYRWQFKVSSDSDLVNIWLSRISNDDIKDPDFIINQTHDLNNGNLNGFVLFPSLLVIQLGVKVASNRETPSVVQEAVSLRYHSNKPTWIVDQPYCMLQEGHKSYSRQLIESLKIFGYEKIKIKGDDVGGYGIKEDRIQEQGGQNNQIDQFSRKKGHKITLP